jgi:hypothetical protein
MNDEPNCTPSGVEHGNSRWRIGLPIPENLTELERLELRQHREQFGPNEPIDVRRIEPLYA